MPEVQDYLSKNIYSPEEYTPEFAKEKIKAFLYYLFSSFIFDNPNDRNGWHGISINFYDFNFVCRSEDAHKKFYWCSFDIVYFNREETNCDYDNYNFLKCLDMVFKKEKMNLNVKYL